MSLNQKIKNVIIVTISLFLLIFMQMETSFAQEDEIERTDSSYVSDEEYSGSDYASDQESADSSYASDQESNSEEETTGDKKAIEAGIKNTDKKSKEFSEIIAAQSSGMGSTSGGTSEKATNGVYSKPEAVSVSQVGAATLSYPIEVPPGRNGLQPNISLQYSSYNGNGWVGVGWDFNMGSISRSTRYGLNYNASEFVADGSDLVSRSSDWGANYYGAKIEGAFTKYYFNTSSNSWVATAKDGTKYFYGQSANSRIANGSNVFSWNLDRVEDTNGNYMTIIYSEDGNQRYLYQIYYTGNAGLSTNKIVEFGLEDRTDIITSYKTKFLVTTAKRLSTITVKVDTDIAYQYNLDYEYSTGNGRSRLTQIQREAQDENYQTVSLPPYEFTYKNGGNGIFTGIGSTTQAIAGYKTTNHYLVFGDINGDGIQDFIEVYSPGGSGSQAPVYVYPYLANTPSDDVPAGFTAQISMTLPLCPINTDTGLTQLSVALGDINGDGKADMVSSGLNSKVHVYLSNSTATNISFEEVITSDGKNNFSNSLADLNGDGKTDLVMSNSDGTVYTAISNGSGSFPTKVKHQLGVGSGTYYVASTRIHMADFNGDGKADIFTFTEYLSLPSYRGYKLMIWYSNANGNGSFDTYYTICDFIDDQIENPGFWYGDETIGDINGDGLADVVYRINFPYTDPLAIALSTGTGMTSFTSNINDKPTLADINDDGMDDLIVTNYVYKSNGDGSFSNPVNVQGINGDSFMADINGDGRSDFCEMASNSDEYDLNCSLANGEIWGDYLKTITNPLGGNIELTYGNSSGFSSNNRMPFIQHPVITIKAYDGIIEEGATVDIPDVTTYDYANGYYDNAERDFRGFGYVKQTNLDNTTIETTYEISNMHKKGRPLIERIKAVGQSAQLKVIAYNWWTEPQYPAPTDWAFVKLKQKRTIYEDNGSYYTEEEYTYDSTNGYPLTLAKKGTNANGQVIEDITQTTIYNRYENYPTNLWTWRLTEETVRGSTTGLARKMTYGYDNKGNMTSSKFWRTESDDYESVVYGHDSYGNVTSERDGIVSHPSTTIAYDSTHTFPVTITNPKGHITTKTWDYRFGKEDIVTNPNGYVTSDPNDNTTDYDYDPFGRVKSVTNMGFNNEIVGYTEYDYTDYDALTTFPRYITTKVLESGNTTTGSYVAKEEYLDGLGRTIKVATDGIDDQEEPNILKIFTTTHYDNMGRKSAVYGPFFNGEAENSRYYEKTYYDKMGRVDYIESPSSVPNDPAIIDYTYDNPFTTKITDPDNKQKTEKRDHLGRIIEVIEHADANNNQSTFYWYNAAGDMLEVENALGSSTIINYDARGLKLDMDDPDMGEWHYTYDENGNLSTQTDAKQNQITFYYDELNRIYNKMYTIPASEPQNTNNVAYRYDGDGLSSCTNCKGQLTSINNTSVLIINDLFDPMGRIKRVSKTISGEVAKVTQTSYDLSGKVEYITHPDNFVVHNVYYHGTGLLDTVTVTPPTPPGGSAVEYAKCTEYEPTGKIGRITHAYNDTETVYTYNPQTTRLENLLTSRPITGNDVIQNNTYSYSKAGDLGSITDKEGIIYTYQYDKLHRLISEVVTGDPLRSTSLESLTFTYPEPNSEHINAVSSINYNGTSYSFSYDANGNMLAGPDFTNPANIVTRNLTWNADNMPVIITRGGVTTNLTYDGNGARVKKVAGGTTTYYVSNDYEIKNGVATKYIFAGNLRVASIDGSDINNSKIFHKDHLGSSTAITDSTGADLETTEYMPFGVQRSHSGANASDYKYTDQELDNESGLYNYDARMYDPVIGRFISADSVVNRLFDPQMLNRYSYCRNNPLLYTDPTGHILYINGIKDPDIYESVLRKLKKIDPSVVLTEVKEGSGKYQVSFDSKIDIGKHVKGHELLEKLAGNQDKTHNVELKTSGGNKTTPIKGGNSEIVWNYESTKTQEGGGPDDHGHYEREPYIGLAHELGHSEAYQEGKQEPRGYLDMNLVRYPSTPKWEKNSIARENDIRRENDQTLRSSYFQSDRKIRKGF
jgi:RHS repeat-associated protein